MTAERVTHFSNRIGNIYVHAGYLTANVDDPGFYGSRVLCGGLRGVVYAGKPPRSDFIGEERPGWERWAFDPTDERACRRCVAAYNREVAGGDAV